MAPLPSSLRSLPRDEILLRLPAKDLCRLRAVCQAWRALLSNPHFAAAHAVRHPGPLIVTGYEWVKEGIICEIWDISGDVVMRVPVQEGFAKEHARKRDIFDHEAFISFGKAPLTGECKVLRILDIKQLCEIFTLGGKDSQWRKTKSPKDIVYLDFCKSVVMDGIVYFLSYLPDCIASFDLHTEVWSEALQGPPSSLLDEDSTPKMYWLRFSMATLNGCLVVVHLNKASSIDLWFLMDLEKGLWVKQHSIPPIPIDRSGRPVICPLFVLDDGRIVLVDMQYGGCIKAYDPRSNTLVDIAVVGHGVTFGVSNRYCAAVGLYTGSLLSPPSSASK